MNEKEKPLEIEETAVEKLKKLYTVYYTDYFKN